MEARIRTGYMQLIFYSAFSLSRFQQVARLDAGQIRHTSRIGTTFSVCVSCKRSPCLDLRKNRLKRRDKTPKRRQNMARSRWRKHTSPVAWQCVPPSGRRDLVSSLGIHPPRLRMTVVARAIPFSARAALLSCQRANQQAVGPWGHSQSLRRVGHMPTYFKALI